MFYECMYTFISLLRYFWFIHSLRESNSYLLIESDKELDTRALQYLAITMSWIYGSKLCTLQLHKGKGQLADILQDAWKPSDDFVVNLELTLEEQKAGKLMTAGLLRDSLIWHTFRGEWCSIIWKFQAINYLFLLQVPLRYKENPSSTELSITC